MRQYINAARFVTKIKMLRSSRGSKAFILVEGITDYRLYGKLMNQEACEIMIAESKSNVIQCIEACNAQKLKGIAGIVDADFWRIEHHSVTLENLFLTDGHDLECMLINSPAFDSILAEYADRSKYLKFEERNKASIKALILRNTADIGYLRWYSLLNHSGFKFSNLNFNKFINVQTLEVDLIQLLDYLLLESKKEHQLKREKVLKAIEELRDKKHDLWDICCGHDFAEILSIGLIHSFGDYNAKSLFAGNLEGSLRLAYEHRYFSNTELYKALKRWQKNNKGYAILEEKNGEAVG